MNRPTKNAYLPVRLSAAQAQDVKALAQASNTTASEVVRKALTLFVSAQLAQQSPKHEP